MGTLYLVRHGQASFGAADYDQLSALGQRQCERLGEYFRGKGLRFDAVLRGSLKRHEQSLAALMEGLGDAPQASVWPGLNEYDSEAVIRAVHAGALQAARNAEEYRSHFRLLRQGLTQWTAGELTPQGMPTFAAFAAGINEVLDHVRQTSEGNVLLVSSGGPISTAVAQVLGAPAQAMIELNLRIRNSALTEFAFTPKRHMLHSFNHLPHLDGEPWADWVTYT
jgi:broad specificity phosphatase PhoE